MLLDDLELLGDMTIAVSGNGREVVTPCEREDLDGVVLGGVLLLVHIGSALIRGRRYKILGYVVPKAATF